MGDLQHSIVNSGIVRCKTRDQVLETCQLFERFGFQVFLAYINECIPSFPKVTVRYHTDCVTKLVLNSWWHRDHEPNELLFDCDDFILWESMVSVFVLIHVSRISLSKYELGRDTHRPFSLDIILEI